MNLIKCCTSAHSSSDRPNLSKKKTTSAKKGGMLHISVLKHSSIDKDVCI